jgi:hypothetical protein
VGDGRQRNTTAPATASNRYDEKLPVAGARWLYNHLGDPRTKNAVIAILLILTGFGVLAPATATSLRDLVLSMVGM